MISCNRSNDKVDETPFDRGMMLKHFADNIIIPAYSKLKTDNQTFDNKVSEFITSPNETTLTTVRAAFVNAYKTFQTASFYEIGPANDEKLRLFLNSYPVNASLIENLALQDDYQLELITNANKQGYPAIDYLLYGLGNSDAEIIQKFSTNTNAQKYKNFLSALSSRLVSKTSAVKSSWENGYKNDFIKNNGSSSYASVDLLANEFLLNYEKFYKEKKIGTPLGASISDASPESVESYYNPTLSSELFLIQTNAMKNFFQGKNYSDNGNGACFKTYLKDLKKEDLANDIIGNFNAIINANNEINETYKNAILNNRAKVSNLYEKLNANTIPMKVDMLQAMNITVAYFDGDGD